MTYTIIICILAYIALLTVVHLLRSWIYDKIVSDYPEESLEQLYRECPSAKIPLIVENHTPTDKNGRFLFFKKRKLHIPGDQLVYVESEYNEEMHKFFTENAEWLELFQKRHGWDIVEYDEEDIKEGMLYPQDFVVFKHGFLWRSNYITLDEESSVFGNTHLYFELDPISDASIKDQMESMMRKIYAEIDWS